MPEVSRRTAIKVLAWTVPTIVTLDITRADAALRHSGPPPRTRPPEHVSTPREPVGVPPMGPALPTGLSGSLPYTGDEQEYEVGVAVVALCAGFALIAHGHEARHLG